MITLIIGIGAVVLLIAAVAAIAVSRVNNSEKIASGRTFKAGNDKQAEWSALSKQYDPEKGYEDSFTESDGYQLCKAFLEVVEETVRDRCGDFVLSGIRAPVKSLAEAEALDPEEYLKSNFDFEELVQMHEAILACAAIGTEMSQEADCACVAANDSKNRIEQARCRDMLSKAFRILEPEILVLADYPTGDGRTGTVEKHAGIGLLSKLARKPDYDLGMAPGARAKALAPDGFRCRRCGRSPLSGGRIVPVWNPYGEQYEALCGDCHNNKA